MENILKVVNKFLKKNFNITAYWNVDFEALTAVRKVGFTIAPLAEDTQFFVNDAIARYPYINADPFLWLLFHEVGHVMTENVWTAEELEYFDAQKESLAYTEDDQMRNDWYHAVPDEFMATRWAANYMAKNQKKVAKFWNELKSAIIKFYEDNQIDYQEKEEEEWEDNLIMIDEEGTRWYRVGNNQNLQI